MLNAMLIACLQIDLVKGMMDCLYAECKPCITDCVLAELEKLGQKYRVALKVAKVRGWDCLCNIAGCGVRHK
jgi:rRNA-processing protein FCF1